MERHHFCFAGDFNPVVAVIQSPALTNIAHAFNENVTRIRSLGVTPTLLVATTILNQTAFERARVELGIPENDSRLSVGHPDYDPAINAQLQSLRIRNLENFKAAVDAGEIAGPQVVGEYNLGIMLNHNGATAASGIAAILNGMVIGAWTTVETLASDLWVKALNSHPVKLAALTGKWHKPEKLEGDDLNEDEEDEEQGKTVKLQDLQMRDYDLSKSMGTVHKYRYKWGLLEGIRRAYGAAFSNDFDDIRTAVEHPSLDALAAARNVLVHKAGVVDSKFFKKHKGWPAFASAKVDAPLVLDGLIVRDLLSDSLGSALKLLNAVDVWLVNH